MKSSISVIRISHLEEGVQEKVLLRGVFINRDTNGEGVLKVGTTLIRVSTVMGILYMALLSMVGCGRIEGASVQDLSNTKDAIVESETTLAENNNEYSNKIPYFIVIFLVMKFLQM